MSKPAPLAVTVTKTIDAPATVLYDLISDVTTMPNYSPETIAVTWLGGATAPVVGAKFKGTNKMGTSKWSTKPTITAAERGSRFAFKVPGGAGAEWTYAFTTDANGATIVTESMVQTKPSPAIIRYLQRRNGVTDRAANLRDAMNTTLDRLAAIATAA
jgi:uncharacterized membrane protein